MRRILLAMGLVLMLSPASLTSAEVPQHIVPTTAVVAATSTVLPNHAYIPQRTSLKVELLDKMDSKKSRVGQEIRFKTIENLVINNVLIIPSGTIGYGKVALARRPGVLGRKGKLSMEATDIKTRNNVTVPLMNGVYKQGRTDGGAIGVAAVLSAVGGIFMKGKGASFDEGAQFEVQARCDTDLGCTFEDLEKEMNKQPQIIVSKY